jgi:hypothetical protein
VAIARRTDSLRANDLESRTSRYRQVAAMRAEGMTFEEIGAVIGRTGERARQILEAGPPQLDGLMRTAAELDLIRRRSELRDRIVAQTAAWRATRTRLREVEEELEARRIDRILGLGVRSPDPAWPAEG